MESTLKPLSIRLESITGGENDCSPIPYSKQEIEQLRTAFDLAFNDDPVRVVITGDSITKLSGTQGSIGAPRPFTADEINAAFGIFDSSKPADSNHVEVESSLDICYISGPMSGLPDNNYPAFFSAESELQKSFKVLNPARNKLDPGQRDTWTNWMRKALLLMLSEHTTHIALLPGWEYSDGAHAELYVARLLKMQILFYEP